MASVAHFESSSTSSVNSEIPYPSFLDAKNSESEDDDDIWAVKSLTKKDRMVTDEYWPMYIQTPDSPDSKTQPSTTDQPALSKERLNAQTLSLDQSIDAPPVIDSALPPLLLPGSNLEIAALAQAISCGDLLPPSLPARPHAPLKQKQKRDAKPPTCVARFCAFCGAETSPSHKFCMGCGEKK
mmetsp:Transcript_115463/g.180350  ORF Transcript_115463/g.180350 Transcript_115463/m.180350 type:complete len:183 (-) Transcript_115463:352-900(-)